VSHHPIRKYKLKSTPNHTTDDDYKMVALEQIRSSNSKISTTLRPGLVAVFAGATSGIGESSLKQFAKNAIKPRIYFLGRSKQSGDRVHAELKKLNPDGEYTFISVDVSLLRSVDDVCRQIKEKETSINLLFLSTGTMVSGKGEFAAACWIKRTQGKLS
jgi:NADP-dependent 3-hydroxy acid dehydrogenase YdfG